MSDRELGYADETRVLVAARIEAERAFIARTDPGRGAVWWASVIGLIGIGLILGAFVYGYFYLRLGAEAWPPVGTELREWTTPALALGAVVVALVLGPSARRGRLLLAGAGLLAAAALVLQVISLAGSGYRPDANAYEALVITIDGLAAVLLAVAVAIRVAAVAFMWPRRGPNALHDADTAFFVGSGAIWIMLWSILHLAPRVI